jgi:Zn-finger protein
MTVSKISNLEAELLSRTKATEQNQTLLKIHIVHLEQELANIYRNIKQLNNDITHLDNSQLEKEKISLELIKELKDELLTTRYALTKASQELKK